MSNTDPQTTTTPQQQPAGSRAAGGRRGGNAGPPGDAKGVSPTAVGLAILCAVCIYGVCHFWKQAVVAREDAAKLQTELQEAEQDKDRLRRVARMADPRELMQLRDTQYDFVVNNYGFEYAGRTGDLIDEQILMYGLWEKGPAFFMRDFLRNCADEQPVFVDVGCNVGHHALFLAQYASQVHGFDPFPPAVERFQSLIERNRMANVTVHPVGLGSEAAELPFFGPHEGNFGSGTFNPKWSEGREELKLRIVRGDEWFPQHGIDRVTLMKIDIEGYEEAALTGLRATLESQRPLVFLEVTPAPEGTIGSYEQLQKLFPENYEFTVVLEYLARTRLDGKYITAPFSRAQAEAFFAGEGQGMIAAYPAERKEQIPNAPFEPVVAQSAQSDGSPEAPAAGSETPAAGSETPAAGSETPAAGNETPVSGNEAPASGSDPLGAAGPSGTE